MKIVVLTGTPKSEGLSVSCVAAAVAGAEKAGASVIVIDLCKTSIGRCQVCGDGWGICRNEHVCAYGDDGFAEVSKQIAEADALVFPDASLLGRNERGAQILPRPVSQVRGAKGDYRADRQRGAADRRAGRHRERASDLPSADGAGGAAHARPCIRLYRRQPLEPGVQAEGDRGGS